MKQRVIQQGKAKFQVFWDKHPDGLILDFNPFIELFNLQGSFVLEHWQARPKGLRRWGLYDSLLDAYYAVDFDKYSFGEGLTINQLQIDETVCKSLPTAVKYYQNCSVFQDVSGLKIWNHWL